MDDGRLQRTIELIERNQSIVDFAPYGEGVPQVWLEKAEAAIGFPLPDSYKWWLANYGGGEIGGEEIFSIYGQAFDAVVGGDVVCMFRLAVKNGQDPTLIPICQSDIDGSFWFEVIPGLEGNEYPVHSQATRNQYADHFLDFLEKRIAAFTSSKSQSEL